MPPVEPDNLPGPVYPAVPQGGGAGGGGAGAHGGDHVGRVDLFEILNGLLAFWTGQGSTRAVMAMLAICGRRLYSSTQEKLKELYARRKMSKATPRDLEEVERVPVRKKLNLSCMFSAQVACLELTVDK
jgi:hypothetical protein